MKSIGCLFLLFLSGWNGLSQTTLARFPYRLYGTNLYDFTEVIRNVDHPNAYLQSFIVRGRLTKLSHGIATVEQVTEMRFRRYELRRDFFTGQVFAAPTGKVFDLGYFMSLTPEERAFYRPEKTIKEIRIKHAEPLVTNLTDKVVVVAYPIKEKNCSFDFGKPFTGNWKDYSQYIRVTAQGLKVTPIVNPTTPQAPGPTPPAKKAPDAESTESLSPRSAPGSPR